MNDSNRTPDASADVRERAGATEDYGGVPISEQELAQVWMAPEGGEASGPAESVGSPQPGSPQPGSPQPESLPPESESADSATVQSTDPGEAGDTKAEVPQDDPQPVEPS
jgi:hypothetical protein